MRLNSCRLLLNLSTSEELCIDCYPKKVPLLFFPPQSAVLDGMIQPQTYLGAELSRKQPSAQCP